MPQGQQSTAMHGGISQQLTQHQQQLQQARQLQSGAAGSLSMPQPQGTASSSGQQRQQITQAMESSLQQQQQLRMQQVFFLLSFPCDFNTHWKSII